MSATYSNQTYSNQTHSNQTYSISDLAREFDVTTRAIRFYEDKGMLSPRRRGQTRVYSSADRTKLKLILRGKRLGFSLDESHDIIAMYNPDKHNSDSKIDNRDQLNHLIQGIRERKSTLQQQLIDIEAMMLDLQGSEERCLKALEDLDN